MNTVELTIEVTKLAATIFGALVVGYYWNRRKDYLESFSYLDKSYTDLLQRYFENPQFGDPESTAKYFEKFSGEDLLRYHYFAMRVHTLMESIYDISRSDIPVEWSQIFVHHSNLHREWLLDNKALHERGYLVKVLGEWGADDPIFQREFRLEGCKGAEKLND